MQEDSKLSLVLFKDACNVKLKFIKAFRKNN